MAYGLRCSNGMFVHSDIFGWKNKKHPEINNEKEVSKAEKHGWVWSFTMFL